MAEGNKKEFQNLIMLSTFLKEKNQCLKPFYRELLMHTVKTKQNLLCRLTLSYCQERETELPYFLEALSLAIQEKEKECAKAIAWLITKMFFLANRVVLLDLIIDIWPALNCKCMIESTIQTLSTQFAIVVELENKTQNVPTKHFPVNVVYLDNEDVAKENPDAEKQGELKAKEKLADKKYITGQSAQKMFANHSKLTLMSKSIVLQHGIIKQCVDFFCKAKGLIPVGENPFPKSFCDMPTKVIQGCPVFMTNLRVGDMIGNDNKRGTVGGFVKVRGDTTFLTCLHLFMSAEELDAENLSLTDDKPVLISCFPAGSSTDASRNSSFVCGKIRDIAFITDNERSTSIDAALVKVKKHIEICPTDYVVNHGTENIPYDRIGLKSPFLNDNCVDYKQFCHPYLSCQIATLSFGAVTGTVKSICGIKDEVETCIDMDMSESSEERMDVDTLGLETAIYKTSNTVEGDVHWQTTFLAKTERKMLKRISRKMYGQIHISNIPFHPGDSGTCIYVTEPFQGCIGMGIANHPMGGCIATPIMEILKHFNIRCNSN